MTIISVTRTKLIAALKEHTLLNAKQAGAIIGMERRATHEALRRMVRMDIADVMRANGIAEYALKGMMPEPEPESEPKPYTVHSYIDPVALPPAFFARAPQSQINGE